MTQQKGDPIPLNFAPDAAKTGTLIDEQLGHVPRLNPAPTAIAVCRQTYPLIRYAPGTVMPSDALFLLTLIEHAQPRHILEIGVSAGASTLFILEYLSTTGAAAALTSVDALDHYYHDPSKPLAFLVLDNLPSIPANWTLIKQRGAATFIENEQLQDYQDPRRYDFVFIDAHHGHPWPTLDCLCLLPFTAAGSWIALHDVCLALIDEQWKTRGPQYLLQEWPLESCLSDDPIPNIGAIRLSDAGPGDVERLLNILEIPWECGVSYYWEEAIVKRLDSILKPTQMDRVRAAFSRYRDLDLVQ